MASTKEKAPHHYITPSRASFKAVNVMISTVKA